MEQINMLSTPSNKDYIIRTPEKVAEVTLCGGLTICIDDTMAFIKPTPEQIKNLKETFCIDVKLFEAAE